MHVSSRERGFTLPELLATVGLFLLVIGLAFLLVHPKDYSSQRRDAERGIAIAQLMQALERYDEQHGQLPPDLPTSAKSIGNQDGEADLCHDFVPILDDVPLDPAAGGEQADKNCASEGAAYTTGFTIQKSANNTVTIAAPYAELTKKLSISHQF